MSNALTLSDMSPALRKVVGRESPRATSAEEPDAGNPLVRIWRGAGMGNRPAYSTTAFSAARGASAPRPPARAARAIQLLVGANVAKGLPWRKGAAGLDLQGCYRHVTPRFPSPAHHVCCNCTAFPRTRSPQCGQ